MSPWNSRGRPGENPKKVWSLANRVVPRLLFSQQCYPNSCPLSRWCHPTISSSIVPFFSCLQSFSESGSFLMSQHFPSGGQSIRASASSSVLPPNIQDWFPLGLTHVLSLLSKGLSRVFSSTTVWKHQFFGAQASLRSSLTSVHNYWKNHRFDSADLCWQSDVSAFSGKRCRLEMGFGGSLGL